MTGREIKQGDTVTRVLGGLHVRLTVTRVDESLIHCGDWTFDRVTGVEVDDDLEWGPAYGKSGSYLLPPTEGGEPG